MTVGRALVLVSVVIFILTSLGAWPDIAADFEPLPLGLAFLAASFLV